LRFCWVYANIPADSAGCFHINGYFLRVFRSGGADTLPGLFTFDVLAARPIEACEALFRRLALVCQTANPSRFADGHQAMRPILICFHGLQSRVLNAQSVWGGRVSRDHL
jgi:hypothetical protein